MTRDLAAARARREESLRQAAVKRENIPEASTKGLDLSKTASSAPAAASNVDANSDATKEDGKTVAEHAKPVETTPKKPDSPSETRPTPSATAPPKPSATHTNTIDLASPSSPKPSAGTKSHPPSADPATSSEAPRATAEAAPATTDLTKLDLESMFPDSSGGRSGAGDDKIEVDTMEFDLDFSGDPALTGDDTQPKAGDAMIVDGATDNDTGTDDMAALLPGLESYANASNDDFSLLGTTSAPAMTTATSTAGGLSTTGPPSEAVTMGFDLNDTGDMMPAESTNFDDLFFNSTDVDLGEGQDGSGGAMDFGDGAGGDGGGEFSDALFNL